MPLHHYAWHEKQKVGKGAFRKESDGFRLQGRLISKEQQTKVSNEQVLLTVKDSVPNLMYTTTDDQGRFAFLLDPSFNNKNIVLQQYGNNNHEKYRWERITKSDTSVKLHTKTRPFTKPEKAYLEYSKKVRLVNAIYHGDSAGKKSNRQHGLGNNFVEPDNNIKPEQFAGFTKFEELSRNILPGVIFKKEESGYGYRVLDYNNEKRMPFQDVVLLNGIYFTDMKYIASLGTKDIKNVMVYNAHIFHGDLDFNGLLAINTFDPVPPSYMDKVFRFKNEVPSSMEFNIKKSSQLGGEIPDFRQILYWNPLERLSDKNTYNFDVVTSDTPGNYLINIQGITNSGTPYSMIDTLTVK